MNIFDYFLLFICLVTVLRGAQLGFFSSFLGVFGWLFGFYLATNYYGALSPYLGGEAKIYYPWLHQALIFFICLLLIWAVKLFLRQVLINKTWTSKLGGSFLNLIKTLILTSLLLNAADNALILNQKTWWKNSLFVNALSRFDQYLPAAWYSQARFLIVGNQTKK